MDPWMHDMDLTPRYLAWIMNRKCHYNLDASIDDPWYCSVGSDSSYRKSTGPVDLRLGLLLSSGFIEVPLHCFPPLAAPFCDNHRSHCRSTLCIYLCTKVPRYLPGSGGMVSIGCRGTRQGRALRYCTQVSAVVTQVRSPFPVPPRLETKPVIT